jgi:putative CocE/NonD family hydrolase
VVGAQRSLLLTRLVAVFLIAALFAPLRADRAVAADDAQITRVIRLPMSDGVELEVNLGGRGPLVNGELPPRPVIAEFSPYGPACCAEYAGPDFNYLQVHIRGTGDSDGAFDALGDQSQRDAADVLEWACHQPWSNGRLGLYGFSASAIIVYNSLHLPLPCVQSAVLGAGTHELYRDLMYPGGIPNQLPALGVLALIGGPSLAAGPARLQRKPLSSLTTFKGMFASGRAYQQHPTLDAWWRERGMRGDVNHIPILMVTGFFDVESRGPFEAFKELRDAGAHLMVVGAHDGVPAGSGGSNATRHRWYDHFLRGVDNGVDREPAVQLWMSDGDREDMLAGQFVTATAEDWPVPGTQWTSLSLDASGSLHSGPAAPAKQRYVAVPSLPTATDPHTTAILGYFNNSPRLTDMTLPERLGLSYTTAAFPADVIAAGPASLELVLSSTARQSDVFAVISDVSPDGVAHPVATGRLRTAYPDIDADRSLTDANGAIVQPHGRYDYRRLANTLQARRYFVEFWPIGNRFRAGHKLRLHIVGASAYHAPSVPAVNTVRVGGPNGSRLLLPVLPAP